MSEIDELLEDLELYFLICGLEGITPVPIVPPPPPGENMLNDPGSNGLVVRTALDTTVARLFSGTPNEIRVTPPDGVTGNFVASLESTLSLETHAVGVQGNNFTIKDDLDASKRVQFRLANVSSGALRLITVPDLDLTLLGTASGQTISNKFLDNTNAFAVKDSAFVIEDNADSSKKMTFELGGLPSNTTITLPVPTTSGALVTTTAVQVLSNKTISGLTNTLTNISEVSLSFSDITLANATTGAHGLLPRLSGNPTDFLKGDGSFAPIGGAGLGDVTSNTTTSIESELVLFTGSTGKLIKRASGSGLAVLSSGVLSVITSSASLAAVIGDETGTGALVFGTGPTLNAPILVGPTGIGKADVGLANVDNTSDATKNSAVATLTNKTISGAANTLTNVSESSLVLTDITTSNATTVAHGFCPKFPGTTDQFLRGDGQYVIPSGSGLGDASTDTAVSVVSELVVFKATTGKTLGRATGTGIAVVTSGVLSTTAQPAGDLVGTTAIQTLTNKTLTSPVITTPSGLLKGDVGLGNVDNTSDATKNIAVATLTNKTLTSPVINTPTGITKGDVGLGNVDNTSDLTKNSASATLTNKRITPRIVSVTPNTTTLTPNSDTSDEVIFLTNLITGTVTINAPTGTPTDAQSLSLRIVCNNNQAATWNPIYLGSTGLPLPASFTASLYHFILFRYIQPLNRWFFVGYALND